MRSTKFYYIAILFLSFLIIFTASFSHFPSLLDFYQNSGMSKDTKLLLVEMNEQLKEVSHIIIAKSNQFMFVDQNNRLHEYCFEYGALWHNDYPLIKDLESFSFEYRDEVGYRLTSSHQGTDLKSIGYTLRLDSSRKPLVAYHQVDINQLSKTVAYRNASTIATIATLSQ